jgi:hypothetical protein
MRRVTTREIGRYVFDGVPAQNSSGSLTFDGVYVYSYSEPIAMLDGGTLYVTTARFSVTTSKHGSAVAGGFAVAHGVAPDYGVADIEHGDLRAHARAAGRYVGSWGSRFDLAQVA